MTPSPGPSPAPVPPQNLEAEESVLGAMMLSSNAIAAVSDVLSPSDFYRESHGTIYRVVLEMDALGRPVDVITLCEALEARRSRDGRCSLLDEIGGKVRIHELAYLVPATANAGHWARIVREMATLRALIDAGGAIARLGWERPGETAALVNQAEQIIAAVTQPLDRAQPDWLIDAADLLAEPDPGPTPWLVEGLIVDQALVAAVGRWKTTKSYGLLDICIAVATGRPAFGKLSVPNPGPVVFVNEESGRTALWRRLDALCRGRGIPPDELRDRLHVAANARVRLDELAWQHRLSEQGARLQPRLICFDPLARMKSSAREENAQSDMAPLIEFLRQLRDDSSAAVLFVHHTGHNGDNMRGSSDLESAWETRLAWKRDGTSPEIEVVSEHREAEAGESIRYRIGWDGPTRSMRFDLIEDGLTEQVADYLREHPEASGNEVCENVRGRRDAVLAAVRKVREQGGSGDGNHPGTTPAEAPLAGGSPAPPFRGLGTTPAEPGSHGAEPDEVERLASLMEGVA